MTVLTPEKQHTPEELLEMQDGDRYELVNGRLVEKNMGFESSWIGGRLFNRLSSFVEGAKLGWAAPEASYQCFPEEPARVGRPDASLIRADRLPGSLPQGHCPVAPDLAVEVISPNDLFSEVREKVEEYLRAGVPLVWIVDPVTRTVEVRRGDGSAAVLYETDELSGEDVVPGFTCPVRDLFPPADTEAVG